MKEAKVKVTKVAVPKKINQTIPLLEVLDNGIFKISDSEYSKMYQIEDSNFSLNTEEGQERIIMRYEQFLSHFPDNVKIEIIIINKRVTEDEIKKSFYLPMNTDPYNEYRESYNSILDKKIKEGRNDIRKSKYVILTARIKLASDIYSTFGTLDASVTEAIKEVNGHDSGARPLSAFERLELMDNYYKGMNLVPFKDRAEKYKVGNDFSSKKAREYGRTVRDVVSPLMIKKAGKHNAYLQLGEDRFVRTYMIPELPPTLDTDYLSKITNIPCEMVTTVLFSVSPRHKAESLVKRQNNDIKGQIIKNSKNAMKSGYDPQYTLSESLLEAKDEAFQLRKEVVKDKKRTFFVTISTTMFASSEEEMKELSEQYNAKNADYSIVPNPLDGQQVAGLKENALTGVTSLARDIMLVSSSACALFPLDIQEIQDKNGTYYGNNSISKNMITYSRKESDLANGLILGKSGSGKSYITKGEMIPNLLRTNDDMIILDPDAEYVSIANALGGTVIDLRRKGEFHINPCDMDMEYGDKEADPLAEKCDYMVSLVESILGDGRECNPMEVTAIHRVTRKMYQPYIEYMDKLHDMGESITIDTNRCPTLVDFYEGLIEEDSLEALKLSVIIEPYCTGVYDLFAHKTDIEGDPRLLVYVTKHLPDKMKTFAMKVCLTNIWTRICKNKDYNDSVTKKDKKATWVYLDEFYLLMATESAATTLRTYYKRVRKYNGIMTGITQDISDMMSSQQGMAMLENSGFFLFMNQSPTGCDRIQQRYRLPDAMVDYLHDRGVGQGLIYAGKTISPFNYTLPTDTILHKLMSTKAME